MPQTLHVVLNDWRADCGERRYDLHQRAIYKYGDYHKERSCVTA